MEFGNSVFSKEEQIRIPEGTQVVFVADMFVED